MSCSNRRASKGSNKHIKLIVIFLLFLFKSCIKIKTRKCFHCLKRTQMQSQRWSAWTALKDTFRLNNNEKKKKIDTPQYTGPSNASRYVSYSSRVITLSPSALDAIPQLGKRQCVNTKAVSPVAKASRCHWFEESLALFLAVHLSLAPSLLVPYVSSIETQNTHLSLLHPLSVPLSSARSPTEIQVSF